MTPNLTQPVGPLIKVQMPAVYKSIVDMYAQWIGQGKYERFPMPGGLQATEKLFKTKWRKHFSSANTRLFNRLKMVMTALQTTIDKSEMPKEEILHIWENKYEEEAKRNIGKFIEILQKEEVIPKGKPRGRSK